MCPQRVPAEPRLLNNATFEQKISKIELHRNRSAMEAGTAAISVEECKRRKYAALAEAHQFEPIAVETMGMHGEYTGVILREIGCRLVEATGDPREANWFRQNLAIAIQRGNAFSILSAGRERF